MGGIGTGRIGAWRRGLPGHALLAVGALAAMLLAMPSVLPASDDPASPVPASAEPVPADDMDWDFDETDFTRPAEAPRGSLASVHVRDELPVAHWLPPGEYVWDAARAPAAGPLVIVVNIRARVLSAYRDGVEIGRSSIVYGTDDKPTPHGTFPILQMREDHYSNLYDNAPMPHMMRLTWDGVAIHGSPTIVDEIATRGCVGLPEPFAALLFAEASLGDEVVIWGGDELPQA